MPYQQKSAQQPKLSHPGINKDGLVELNDDELESIAGGKGAMAQDQIIEAEIQALQQDQNHSQVSITNNNPSYNINSSQSSIGGVRK